MGRGSTAATCSVGLIAVLGLIGPAAVAQDPSAPADASLEQRLARLADRVSPGSRATLGAYLHDARKMERKDGRYARRMSARVADILDAAERGEDLIAAERDFLWRGYRSRYSDEPQLYSIYVPESYDPATPVPLLVTLHGGSSNHNVWLALNLGHQISTADYWDNHRTRYRALRHPDAIVVAPDGLGQVRWRWMGEQDVLDVIDDVAANYNVDTDRIILSGLSNGGIGSYTIGLKHAYRFAAVLPLAGVTDWLKHHEAEGRWRPCERTVLANESAITYAENAANTHLRFFHGAKDPGFSVEQARRLADKLKRLGVPFRYHEFANRGHDLSSVLWYGMRVMRYFEDYRRLRAPAEVRLVTASGRANRQAWLVLENRVDHLRPGRLRAAVVDRHLIEVETENVERFTVRFDENPVRAPFALVVDGREAYTGPRPPDGRLTLALALAPTGRPSAAQAHDGAPLWRPWDGALPAPGSRKVDDGLAGPIGDANYERQVHVYGTQVADDVEDLRRAAELGARGWMRALDYTAVRHPVIPDTELTDELQRTHAVVLYGNARNNSALARVGARLPIVVGPDYLGLRGERLTGDSVGARFVCPNPLAPERYLVVQAGVTAAAVESGGNLPIYLGDYLVYDRQTTNRRAFMILGRRPEIETGFFTESWRLPATPPPR